MMIKYIHQMQDIKQDVEYVRIHRKKEGKETNYNKFSNDILTLDIETTSAWITEDNRIIPYEVGHTAEYWNSLTPLALCYIWQFSFNDTVYYGRELTDFINVLRDLRTDVKYIIWVHNLSFEFHFLQNILEFDNVFARSAHKPIKAISKEFPNIEFRCSYMLTRLSLATWGDQIGIQKMVGDLDYEVIRTPYTALTETEMGYCERDCIVVYNGIKKYVELYKKQRDIPLTQTGTVREVVKERLFKNKKYTDFIKKLVPKNAEQYKMLRNIFAGGYTHANRLYAGEVLREEIEHYDFASSYPTVMLAEKYPMTPWVYAGNKLPKKERFDKYAYIMLIKFTQVKSTSYNSYIQVSKCMTMVNPVMDNGRIVTADEITLWVTEQDYITIDNNYTFEAEVKEVYRSKKEYLPRKLLEYILELYRNKTTLKGVKGKEDLYLQSKQYINSLFGMSVTAIVQADVTFKNGLWEVDRLTPEYVDNKLQDLAKYKSGDKRYFMNYSWGCWVTAYARRNLWKCIESVDRNVIYCDTDSIFVRGKNDFTWYNKEIIEKLRISCEENELNFEDTHPLGKQIGIFDKEDDCIEFITLGAKRYVERRKDGILYLTVSGINKGAVGVLKDDISNFRDGLVFDKDDPCVVKRLVHYVYDMPDVVYPDGYKSTYRTGISMRRNGYELHMTDEYKTIIDYANKVIREIPEQAKISSRGDFRIAK